MPDFLHMPQRLLARASVDNWAVAIVIAFIVLIIAGVLPRAHW
jgi:hypothetical protein